MDVREWVREHGGIAHRSDVLEQAISPGQLRAAIDRGEVSRVRRYWVATPDAPPDLVRAAEVTARVSCISAAHLRRSWIPPDADARLHLCVRRHAQPPVGDPPLVVHWSHPIVPTSQRRLIESVEDSLQHIADCLPREQALVLWEDAARVERIAADSVRRIDWRSPRSRELAAALTGLMGSGLETIFLSRLAPWGLALTPQASIAGHDVDLLIGQRLIAQVDGFAYHSSSADRTRDLAHDRELATRGYTVLRFSYSDVLYHWERVESAVARAVAQGLHRAPRSATGFG